MRDALASASCLLVVMSNDVQNIKQLPQRALPENLRMEAYYETATCRLFYTVSITVVIARGTAENLVGLASQMKRRGLEGVLTQD